MKIVLIGASGTVGSAIVQELGQRQEQALERARDEVLIDLMRAKAAGDTLP